MKKEGFTIIEFIITIGIMAILGSAILYYLNPAQQYAQARNNERTAHINIIGSAIRSRLSDNRGNFATTTFGLPACPAGNLPTTTKIIGNAAGNYDIAPCLISYLPTVPFDPLTGATASTGYTVLYNTTTTQVTISANSAELGQSISVIK